MEFSLDFSLGFLVGAIWTVFCVTLFVIWLFLRFGEVLAVKNRLIEKLWQKNRLSVGILRDRDGRTAV
jgi:hypothetical protein